MGKNRTVVWYAGTPGATDQRSRSGTSKEMIEKIANNYIMYADLVQEGREPEG